MFGPFRGLHYGGTGNDRNHNVRLFRGSSHKLRKPHLKGFSAPGLSVLWNSHGQYPFGYRRYIPSQKFEPTGFVVLKTTYREI